ncbi:MAG: T9SS type A sorting domain-containing protein [Chitinophagaceae bacterium]|nr:MAG: T9SS type A sorting domain-containing protein [Chitinophagaceae bacterium]
MRSSFAAFPLYLANAMKKTLLLLLIFSYSISFATTYTFIGSGSWSNVANWSGGLLPPSSLPPGDKIEINGSGTCSLDVDLTIVFGGTLEIKAGKTLSISQPNKLVNAGNVTCFGSLFNNSLISATNTIYIENGGTLQNAVTGDIHLSNGGEIFYNGTGTFVNNGLIRLEDPAIGIYLGPVVLQNNGIISGNGGIQGVTNNQSSGIISPGNGAGNIYFTSLTNTGTINIELGGVNQNAQYDVITAYDNVIINGGTLNISFINGFLPRGSQSFTILLNGAHNGTFTQVNFPAIAGVTWTIQYLADRIIIHTLSTLPVRFLSFNGRPVRNEIELDWKTAVELNNAGFSIERSENGVNWTAIGLRAANSQKAYSFTDQRPFSGINYYRLKQMDSTGNSTYSSVINVRMIKDKWSIYPNPAQNNLWLTGKVGPNTSISIYSISGNLVKQVNATSEQIDISNLPSSTYILQIVKNGEIVRLPFSKN